MGKPSQIVQLAYLDLGLKSKGGIVKQRNFFGYIVEEMERKAFRNLFPKNE
jgi:hypothetical protein